MCNRRDNNRLFTTKDLTLIALFVALIAVCSWIYIPITIPVTLQTFAVFTTLAVLGGKRGMTAICSYILLGLVGLPVFSGFRGGIGILLGPTGGYITGFILSGLVFWSITNIFGTRTNVLAFSMIIGLLLCYAFGTVWFMVISNVSYSIHGLLSVINICVIPFIIPDLAKIFLSLILSKRIANLI